MGDGGRPGGLTRVRMVVGSALVGPSATAVFGPPGGLHMLFAPWYTALVHQDYTGVGELAIHIGMGLTGELGYPSLVP